MTNYQKQADLLRAWTVDEVKAQPALALGQMHSAAATIERLGAEVDRLNKENFWLTKPAPDRLLPRDTASGRVIELPPLEVGGIAWGFRRDKARRLIVVKGTVHHMEFDGEQVHIFAKYAFRGIYGKSVFSTQEEAKAALARLKAKEKEAADD